MPELPPPPPPPLSLGAALVDLVRRHRPVWATASRLRFAAGAAAVVFALVVGVTRVAEASRPLPEVALPYAGTADDPASDPTTGAGAAGPADGPVAVHAAGAFVNPGLYELPAGSRVAALVEAAGGAGPDAVLDALNLAARLHDGDRIYLPRAGEQPLVTDAGAGAGAGAGSTSAGIVDLNTATMAELDALPGVGPATAQAILDYRREKGRFRSVDELREVRGIGEAKLGALRARVRV